MAKSRKEDRDSRNVPIGDSADERRAHALFQQEEARNAVADGKEMPGWKESRDRVQNLARRLDQAFVNRSPAVRGILAALISRAGSVLLGPPGTGKSLLVSRVARECNLRVGTPDANYFEYLLTAHTMPEEIFGPTDIGLLLQNPPVVLRRTEARLPHAELAFLDEVFRGGSHILNTLLTVLNERRFHNGRTVEDVPLVGVIGAANHPPQTEELQAFYDRFPVRIWVDSVLRESGAARIERARTLLEKDSGAHRPIPSADQDLSMNDFRKLWALLRVRLAMGSGKDLKKNHRVEEFTDNFHAFQADAGLSDRSFVQLWYFAGALDLLEGVEPQSDYSQGGRGHFWCFDYVAPTERKRAELSRRMASRMDRRSPTGP